MMASGQVIPEDTLILLRTYIRLSGKRVVAEDISTDLANWQNIWTVIFDDDTSLRYSFDMN